MLIRVPAGLPPPSLPSLQSRAPAGQVDLGQLLSVVSPVSPNSPTPNNRANGFRASRYSQLQASLTAGLQAGGRTGRFNKNSAFIHEYEHAQAARHALSAPLSPIGAPPQGNRSSAGDMEGLGGGPISVLEHARADSPSADSMAGEQAGVVVARASVGKHSQNDAPPPLQQQQQPAVSVDRDTYAAAASTTMPTSKQSQQVEGRESFSAWSEEAHTHAPRVPAAVAPTPTWALSSADSHAATAAGPPLGLMFSLGLPVMGGTGHGDVGLHSWPSSTENLGQGQGQGAPTVVAPPAQRAWAMGPSNPLGLPPPSPTKPSLKVFQRSSSGTKILSEPQAVLHDGCSREPTAAGEGEGVLGAPVMLEAPHHGPPPLCVVSLLGHTHEELHLPGSPRHGQAQTGQGAACASSHFSYSGAPGSPLPTRPSSGNRRLSTGSVAVHQHETILALALMSRQASINGGRAEGEDGAIPSTPTRNPFSLPDMPTSNSVGHTLVGPGPGTLTCLRPSQAYPSGFAGESQPDLSFGPAGPSSQGRCQEQLQFDEPGSPLRHAHHGHGTMGGMYVPSSPLRRMSESSSAGRAGPAVPSSPLRRQGQAQVSGGSFTAAASAPASPVSFMRASENGLATATAASQAASHDAAQHSSLGPGSGSGSGLRSGAAGSVSRGAQQHHATAGPFMQSLEQPAAMMTKALPMAIPLGPKAYFMSQLGLPTAAPPPPPSAPRKCDVTAILGELCTEFAGLLPGYSVGKVIGEGGFCQVRLGVQHVTGRKVAVKIIDKLKLSDPNEAKRIQREIRVMRHLNHECVIRLFEVIDTTTRLFLVMEHAPNGSLLDYVRARKRLAEPDAAFILQQVVAGLEYCHRREVVHRDVKLENLLLDVNNQIKIIDFGLSAFFIPGKRLRVHCGSPSYAAPEIVSRKLYEGPAVDVWSLGVVLFAMLAGYLPFHSSTGNKQELCNKIIAGQFVAPDYLSKEAHDILKRCVCGGGAVAVRTSLVAVVYIIHILSNILIIRLLT